MPTYRSFSLFPPFPVFRFDLEMSQVVPRLNKRRILSRLTKEFVFSVMHVFNIPFMFYNNILEGFF